MRLTYKERVTIGVLVAISLIILSVRFVIMPLAANAKEKETLLTDMKTESQRITESFEKLSDFEETLISAKKKAEGKSDGILAPLKSYQVQSFIEELCAKAGVKIEGLILSEYLPIEFTVEGAPEKTPEELAAESEAAESAGEIDPVTGEPIIPEDGKNEIIFKELNEFTTAKLSRTTVNVQISGSFNQMLAFIDAVEGNPVTRLLEFSIDTFESQEGNVTNSLAIDLYAVDMPESLK